MKKIDNLHWRPFWNSQLGALKSCAEALGSDITDAWLFGGTGAAFVLHMDPEGFGANGPWQGGPMMNLCHNLGLMIQGVYGFKTDPDFAQKQIMAWENTRLAIDRGFPCYGYNLGIPEYYVVNGYDENGYWFRGIGTEPSPDDSDSNLFDIPEYMQILLEPLGDKTYVKLDHYPELIDAINRIIAPRGMALAGNVRIIHNGGIREVLSTEGHSVLLRGNGFTPWTKPGTVHIGLLEMYWVEPCRQSDDRTTVREALEFALQFAKAPRKWVSDPYTAGIPAYEQWIRALESEQPNAFALAYSGQCWAECRRMGEQFLSEAAARIDGEAGVVLRDAWGVYREVAEQLEASAALLPFGAQRSWTREMAGYAAPYIRRAMKAEESGSALLAKAAALL
ncbi:hypothetical protein ACFQI7_19870 [Paenibacillus allorhizosphaerae]|uniref:Uncharacterized protein n=1 Tax=Paenibacillus allorhizosphaerae TaxID=2849866 RepID=A0ABN7TQW6_9BACL|nr:hypothetical protein [Paenibacillus allorhizosphaerae]CAG7647185.1 hypothetical protein PAECIP111802_03912 [Paenibacillus allorhizosphaerae]